MAECKHRVCENLCTTDVSCAYKEKFSNGVTLGLEEGSVLVYGVCDTSKIVNTLPYGDKNEKPMQRKKEC